MRKRRELCAQRRLLHDDLDDARPVPQEEEIDCLELSLVVQPSLQEHALPGVLRKFPREGAQGRRGRRRRNTGGHGATSEKSQTPPPSLRTRGASRGATAIRRMSGWSGIT